MPDNVNDAESESLEVLASWLRDARRITVLTGAGISTDSGIPDFRGPQGVWTKDPEAEKLSNIRYYISMRELRVKAWASRLEQFGRELLPNAGHYALVHMMNAGKLHALITQNTDGLHLDAGIPDHMLYEVHGTRKFYRCVKCRDRGPLEVFLDRVRAGEEDPPCRACGGIVKTDVILFGEDLIPEVINGAFHAAQNCDLFIAIGTTLGVSPVNGTVLSAKRAGARVAIVNGGPTKMDNYADLIVHGSISTSLMRLNELAGIAS